MKKGSVVSSGDKVVSLLCSFPGCRLGIPTKCGATLGLSCESQNDGGFPLELELEFSVCSKKPLQFAKVTNSTAEQNKEISN